MRGRVGLPLLAALLAGCATKTNEQLAQEAVGNHVSGLMGIFAVVVAIYFFQRMFGDADTALRSFYRNAFFVAALGLVGGLIKASNPTFVSAGKSFADLNISCAIVMGVFGYLWRGGPWLRQERLRWSLEQKAARSRKALAEAQLAAQAQLESNQKRDEAQERARSQDSSRESAVREVTSLVIYAQRLRGTTEDDVLLEAMLRDSALIMKDPAVLSAISANQILAKDMRVLLSLLKQRGHGKTVLYSRLASLVPLHSRLWFGR